MSIDLGAAIYIALKPILKIYSIIFIGYLLAKYRIVDPETARGISNMVVNAILPCLTFNKIVSNISWKDIKIIGVIILSAFLLFAVGACCSLLTKAITPVPKQWFWGLLFAGIFPNISDLPIAYMQSMGNGTIFTEDEADKGVAYSCIFLTAQSFFMMNFGMWRIIGLDFKDVIRKPDDIEDSNEKSDDSLIPQDNIEEAQSNAVASKSVLNSLNESVASVRSNDSQASISQITTNEAKYPIPLENVHLRSTNAMANAYRTCTVASSPGILENSRMRRTNNYFAQKGHNDFASVFTRDGDDTASLHKNPLQRKRRSTMKDMIAEYSVVERIRSGHLDLSRPLTLTEDVGKANSMFNPVATETASDNSSSLSRATTHEDATVSLNEIPLSRPSTTVNTKVAFKTKFSRFIRDHKLGWLIYILINFCRPASLGALLGIVCALIPWIKALFVTTYVHVHLAPDQEPVLNFLMDFTSYIGNACIPLGLLMLGGTLARLEIKSLPKGFFRVAICMTVCRLIILPIIGVAWANKLYNLNWLETSVAKFNMILTWSVPAATAQVYFTAFYTPVEGAHTQMDCLSVFFLMQYSVLFITLSFVITYALKVDLKV